MLQICLWFLASEASYRRILHIDTKGNISANDYYFKYFAESDIEFDDNTNEETIEVKTLDFKETSKSTATTPTPNNSGNKRKSTANPKSAKKFKSYSFNILE